MATSAFKSTSRRTTSTNPVQSAKQNGSEKNPTHKAPIRRSRSVSAFSRTQLDVTLDFQNKRENPLFWVDGSGSPRSDDDSGVRVSKFDDISLKSIDPSSVKSSNAGVESGRGRSVSRSSGGGERKFSVASDGGRKGFGRSSSRVDTGRRRRSPSRGPSGNFERRDRESGFSSDVSSKSKISSNANRSVPGEKNKLVRSASDLSEVLKSWNTWSNQHRVLDTADDPPISLSGSRRLSHWDDGASTGSISEAEEKTIIPVSEVKKTMLRSNPEISASNILSGIPPELANLNAEELLRDCRGDFSRELEECEERARKLRVELAVEEHRELELNKILNEITPEPKTPQIEKPRAVRKASMERRKMSKRLEEEAIAYFDECVSISTFDDSDFSSLEDPPSNATGAGVAYPFGSQDLKQSRLMNCTEDSHLPSNNGCNDSPNRSSPSSSKTKAQYPIMPTISLEQDIRNYVKICSKDVKRENTDSQIAGRDRKNTEECTSQTPVEEFLLNRVIFRSRIESGSMLLCGGSFGLPFASIL